MKPILALLTLFTLALAPAAQLDLPKGGKKRPSGGSRELPSRPRGDLGPRGTAGGTSGGERAGGTRGLDLPPAAPGTEPASAAGAAEGEDVSERASGAGAPAAVGLSGAALDGPEIRRQLDAWLALGPEGIASARTALTDVEPAALLAAGRFLIEHGAPEDRAAVAARLRANVSVAPAERLVRLLLERDPVTASPAWLCELLDHGQAPMRQLASEVLAERLHPSLVPFLAARLESKRSDTRLRVLELLESVPDPGALQLSASALGDSKARVAARAVETFVRKEGAEIDALLRDVAFDERAVERARGYALLALVEREDRLGQATLRFEDVPALLEGLDAGEPIVVGASAAALAGVGYRTPASPASAWLDLQVPHTLVRLGSGAEFHRDFTSLQPVALRRLGLLSGERFGLDGRAWRQWWGEAARSFRARRAVLTVSAGDELRLSVEAPSATGVTRLAGPDAPGAGDAGTLLLSEADARTYLDVLAREGVFGLERIPRDLPSTVSQPWRLQVAIGERTKRFLWAERSSEPWVARVLAEHQRLADANAWQRYLFVDETGDARAALAARRALVEREAPFWSEEHTPLERSRRLKQLVFDALARDDEARLRPTPARERALAELARLVAEPGVATAEDVGPLITLLVAQPVLDDRAVELRGALVSCLEMRDPRELRSEEVAELRDLARHGEQALPSLSALLAYAPQSLSELARDVAAPSVLRRAAARACAQHGKTEVLLELVEGEDPTVVVEAIEGLGVAALSEADDARVRALLLEGLEAAPRSLVPAYFRALGRRGGAAARDALVAGLAEDEPRVQLGALEGLAELADPSTTALLVSVLRRDMGPESRRAARRGLRAIGPDAEEQLLRVLASKNERARREAALLLAERCVPQAAPVLITLLSLDGRDETVARELALLSGLDPRQEADPAEAWWDWWDLVVHDDAASWLCAAVERAGRRAPDPAALSAARAAAPSSEARATQSEAARFLLQLATDPPNGLLARRARRELALLLGERDATALEDTATLELRRMVDARFPERSPSAEGER